ncbi:MAG: hypothetical protein WA738_01530 [Candidatus Angelobacter sp.]
MPSKLRTYPIFILASIAAVLFGFPAFILTWLMVLVGIGALWVLGRLWIVPKGWFKAVVEEPSSGFGPYQRLSAVLGAVLVGAIILLVMRPSSKSLLALLGIIGAAMAWSIRGGIQALQSRARLIILEQLSQGPGQTRQQLKEAVRSHSAPYRLFTNLYVEALDGLITADKVTLKLGLYYSASAGDKERGIASTGSSSVAG